MKLATVINSLEALKELGRTKMKAPIAFRIKKLISVLAVHESAFIGARKELFEKFGKDSGDGILRVQPEHVNDFNIEYEALLEEDIEVDIPNITIDDISDVEIEPSRLLTLDWLIVE